MVMEKWHQKLSVYRFEFLLTALVLLIFDKIFFPSQVIFIRYIWPANMLLIALACFGIFIEKNKWIKSLRNGLSILGISIPFGFLVWSSQLWFIEFLTIFYLVYYSFIFWEVMRQITAAKEVRLNVVLGSFCGYMLLCLISLFCYILIELNFSQSFGNISYGDVPAIYQELMYFSFITLSSIGFGDMSRLVVAFFGMLGQFYLVAVIGIIVSKFSSSTA